MKNIFNSLAKLTSISLCLVGFSSYTQSAKAQTNFEFSIDYNTEFLFPPLENNLPDSVDITPFIEDLPPEFQAALPENLPSVLVNPTILDVLVTGESVDPDPAFGLTNFTSDTFGLPLPPQTDENGQPLRQVSIFRADPADLNISIPTPEFSDVYFGDDTGNRLFGRANDRAIFDFEAGTVAGGGTITIVGGEGTFEGASGFIEFSQEDELAPPGEPTVGVATLDFFVQVPEASTTPEPNNTAIVAAGIFASVALRRWRSRIG